MIAEAKKRGYLDNSFCPLYSNGKEYSSISKFNKGKIIFEHFNEKNTLSFVKRHNEWLRIFVDGKWAKIIPIKKMTPSEIEKELGYKIEIVIE